MITVFECSSVASRKIHLQLAGIISWNYVVYSLSSLAKTGPLVLENSLPLHLYSNFEGDLSEQYKKKIPGNESMNLMIMDSQKISEEIAEFISYGWKTQSILIPDNTTDFSNIGFKHEHILIPFQNHFADFKTLREKRWDLYNDHMLNRFNKVTFFD